MGNNCCATRDKSIKEQESESSRYSLFTVTDHEDLQWNDNDQYLSLAHKRRIERSNRTIRKYKVVCQVDDVQSQQYGHSQGASGILVPYSEDYESEHSKANERIIVDSNVVPQKSSQPHQTTSSQDQPNGSKGLKKSESEGGFSFGDESSKPRHNSSKKAILPPSVQPCNTEKK
ncbi:unnamed protein product [Moneuplotes crassus]|uniref:Uncharacterized protein n=1 Tax=Euplotes crassus TaxID=5936 RepID=A0AAD1XDR8_EUPCR|nr:unnamed protein product [Moneuplotes crassus]